MPPRRLCHVRAPHARAGPHHCCPQTLRLSSWFELCWLVVRHLLQLVAWVRDRARAFLPGWTVRCARKPPHAGRGTRVAARAWVRVEPSEPCSFRIHPIHTSIPVTQTGDRHDHVVYISCYMERAHPYKDACKLYEDRERTQHRSHHRMHSRKQPSHTDTSISSRCRCRSKRPALHRRRQGHARGGRSSCKTTNQDHGRRSRPRRWPCCKPRMRSLRCGRIRRKSCWRRIACAYGHSHKLRRPTIVEPLPGSWTWPWFFYRRRWIGGRSWIGRRVSLGFSFGSLPFLGDEACVRT